MITGFHEKGGYAQVPFIRYGNEESRAIPIAAGYQRATAYGISGDGAFVVDTVIREDHSHNAYVWSADQGMKVLGSLVGTGSEAHGVSDRGTFVVGEYLLATDNGCCSRAFIWDGANGMRELNRVLAADFNLDLGGWILKSVSATGPDRRTLVGVDRTRPVRRTLEVGE